MNNNTAVLAELVLDETIYPRGYVNEKHIANLVEALSVGAQLPPILVDKKSHRVVDGWHRTKAYERSYGPAAEITVQWVMYKSERELVLDAIRHNACHGRPLTDAEKVRGWILAKKRGSSMDEAAVALNVTMDTLARWNDSKIAQYAKGLVVVKPAATHMAGMTLTRKQWETNRKLGGNNATFSANQLIMLIESDMLNTANARLMGRLSILYGLLDTLALNGSK